MPYFRIFIIFSLQILLIKNLNADINKEVSDLKNEFKQIKEIYEKKIEALEAKIEKLENEPLVQRSRRTKKERQNELIELIGGGFNEANNYASTLIERAAA